MGNINNTGNAADFRVQQDDIFGRIATRYDLLSDLFSLGIHRLWKQKVASTITKESWNHLLDSATGTGDVVMRVLRVKRPQRHQTIVASDLSPQMLAMAQKRWGNLASLLEFRLLDAESMPDIPNASVDVYSISLGLKICERNRVFHEAFRVLRPGGKFISLEASNITWSWLHNLYLIYMKICMPIIGWIATGGDASAYLYLLRGIQDFPSAEMLAKEMESVGFKDVSFQRLSLGIVAIHIARKPMLK